MAGARARAFLARPGTACHDCRRPGQSCASSSAARRTARARPRTVACGTTTHPGCVSGEPDGTTVELEAGQHFAGRVRAPARVFQHRPVRENPIWRRLPRPQDRAVLAAPITAGERRLVCSRSCGAPAIFALATSSSRRCSPTRPPSSSRAARVIDHAARVQRVKRRHVERDFLSAAAHDLRPRSDRRRAGRVPRASRGTRAERSRRPGRHPSRRTREQATRRTRGGSTRCDTARTGRARR